MPEAVSCPNCGAVMDTDRCDRCGRPRALDAEYLGRIEELARAVVREACAEESFEVFGSQGPKTPLQRAITDLACELRYWHYEGDGCLDH